MSDQFSEWDKFYRHYERLEDESEAFKKYRQSRKRRGTLPQTLNPQQKMQMEYEMRVEKRRVEALQERANDLARESAVRASKSITSSFYAKNGSRLQSSNQSLGTPESSPAEESSETKTSSGSDATKNS